MKLSWYTWPSRALYGSDTDCALMVMPRSRSIGFESSTCASISRASSPPQIWMIRSASVDLPWSTCAMIEKLRICCIWGGVMPSGAVNEALSHTRRARPGITGSRPRPGPAAPVRRAGQHARSGHHEGDQAGALRVADQQADAIAALEAAYGGFEFLDAGHRGLADLQDDVARLQACLPRRNAGHA